MSNLGHEKLIHFKYSQWKWLWHFEFKACDRSTLTSIYIKIVTVTVVCPAMLEEIKSRRDKNHNKNLKNSWPERFYLLLTVQIKNSTSLWKFNQIVQVPWAPLIIVDVGDIFRMCRWKSESVTNIPNLSPTQFVDVELRLCWKLSYNPNRVHKLIILG